ncbi:MAG: alkaline phosphatase D family protein [Opitutales bacterium]
MNRLARPALGLAAGLLLSTTLSLAEKPLSIVAFGSCLQEKRPQPIWESVLASKPDLFVLLGDNIYGDTRDMVKLKAKWRVFEEKPGFLKLRETCRILGIWDDHDYGENDAGIEYPKKVESQQIFLDFLGEPKGSVRRKTPGIYDAVTIGPKGKRVQFILLDTRYFRTALKRKPNRKKGTGPYGPNESGKAEVLGKAQWKWLETTLGEPAEIRVIASSIQVVSTTHGWETWGNFPQERQRLLDLLKKTKANGVIILSGDRHSAEISKLDGTLSYPLFDVTASAMNQTQKPTPEENPHRLGDRYFKENFGLLRINWSKPEPNVTMEIRALDGKVVRSAITTLAGKK